MLQAQAPQFWEALLKASQNIPSFSDALVLSNLRKKAMLKKLANSAESAPLKFALLGGYTPFPLQDLLDHLLWAKGFLVKLHVGDFDNYAAEILDEKSPLYAFQPQLIALFPSHTRCHYGGHNSEEQIVQEILNLCQIAHDRSGADILLSNFALPSQFDPGTYRTKNLQSQWNFLKTINLELGLKAPTFVHICDAEFLSCRRGTLHSQDLRAWFESKQLGSPEFMLDIAKELAHLSASLRTAMKKVLVVDLDNTLWGGVIGDDGMEGIELGDTSPRGEAFKYFQRFLKSLKDRGILLAVCSKNDNELAHEAIDHHPEMVLRSSDFVTIKANWNPKPGNLKAIAAQLDLGLDSLVFADDNPAEVEAAQQLTPEVCSICLGTDPATFVNRISDARLFEPLQVTQEDAQRTKQYQQEAKRRQTLSENTDLDSYLLSLQMEGTICNFDLVDLPRITQLINKTNQFNLTTIRRAESEIKQMFLDPNNVCLSMRLSDRFGDHGLISVLIGATNEDTLTIDTWLMSCRVLQRGVEEEIFNALLSQAKERRVNQIIGTYIPTKRNKLVSDLYGRFGFEIKSKEKDRVTYRLSINDCTIKPTRIKTKPFYK